MRIVTLTFLLAALPLGASEMDALINAFASIRTNTVWPVVGSNSDDIEETFGPRRQPSAGGRYDWHRGIDIDEAHGHNIVAALTGEFNRYTNFTGGGWTVVLKHTFADPIQFRGKTLRNYYTFYMHLDDAGTPAYIKEAQTNGAHPIIPIGQVIGLMGNTGEGPGGEYHTHLHFELRVGTLSSLEFQLSAFDPASASFYGFDPHMHPMLLFPPGGGLAQFELTRPVLPGFLSTNTITMPNDDFPILNRLEVETFSANGQSLDVHALDLNLREGFDATSTAALDTAQTNRPYLAPLYFVDAQTNYQTQLVLPPEFLAAAAQVKFRAWDIWGNMAERTYPVGAPAISIERVGGNVRIRTPEGYAPGVFETTPRLKSGTPWTPIAASVLEIPTAGAEGYVRLRWSFP